MVLSIIGVLIDATLITLVLMLAAALALVWVTRRHLRRRERTNARGEVLGADA